MSGTIRITKMHGAGNDYVYVDCRERDVNEPPRLARAVSRRHHGIGADGLILIRAADDADCRMEMYNADGGRGEMCGNGVRCVGKFVYDRGRRVNPMRIAPDCGVKTLEISLDARGRAGGATVDMGVPILDGPRIPVAARARDRSAARVDGDVAGHVRRWAILIASCSSPTSPRAPAGPARTEFEHHPFFRSG
jgi:diaminopimelate epimerase